MEAELLVKMEGNMSCPWCHDQSSGGGVFRRLALLPNIPDQKYTLGRHYTSREEQGEFVLCDVEGVSQNPGGHFEIKCGDAGFFIKPLEGAGDVALNGRALLPQDEQTLLQFDDEIQLGSGPDSVTLLFKAPLYDSFVNYSLYRFPEISSCLECRVEKVQSRNVSIEADANGEDDVEVRQVSPLDNPPILHQVMEFLSTHDLRQTRHVSPFWEAEATRLLMKKTLLPIHLTSNDPMRWMSLFHWHTQMRHFCHSRGLKIDMTHEPVDWNPPLEEPEEKDDDFNAKTIDDLSLFFLPLAPQLYLTTLNLKMNIMTPLEVEILLKILESMCPNHHLKSLDLSLYPNVYRRMVNVNASELDRLRQMAFPSLTQLHLRWCLIDGDEDAEEVERADNWRRFLETFVQSRGRGLEAFGISTSDMHACDLVLKALDITSVRKLIIKGSRMYPACEPVLDRIVVTFPPNQLTHLELLEFGDRDEEDGLTVTEAQSMSIILRNQARSLQKLKLTLPTPPEEANQNVAVPAMHGLKSLEVRYTRVAHCVRYPVGMVMMREPERGGGVTFPDCVGGVLNYATNFPQINTLKVYPLTRTESNDREDDKFFEDVWSKNKDVMGVWLPLDGDAPCRTVVDLDVPYIWKNKEGQTLLTKGVDLKKLKKAFPNTLLPKLEDVLKDWRNRVLAVSAALKVIGEGGFDDEIEAAIRTGTALAGIEEAIKEIMKN